VPARILVVDDSPTILKVVSSILARHGFEPETARDGIMGLKLLAASPRFDLVLLDFVMPRMNGYQFCRELRSQSALKAVPVVLMSAKGDRIRQQFVEQTGAVDAITKPFDAIALVAVVEGALAKLAAGRGPVVPEGETMPDESSIGEDEVRPSMMPRKLQRQATDHLVRHIAAFVTPSILELADAERRSADVINKTFARALGTSPLDGLLLSLREASSATTREVLSGDLAFVPLPEVLQMLQMQRQTGVIRIVSGERACLVSIRDGTVDLAQSTGERSEFKLGRYFVEQGHLTRAKVEAAVHAASASGRRLGDELVLTKQATDEQRRDALQKQSCELLYDLVRWQYGRFWFARDPLTEEAEAAKLGLGVGGLLLEGFRRVDEWRLMESTIQWDQVVVLEQAALSQIESALTRADRMLIEAVDGERTISQIIAASDLGSFDAVKIVYQFLSSRVLRAKA
jgi:DNA-binding response OmpR family regulator